MNHNYIMTGYATGVPSQSNGIENSHRQLKAFEDIKSRTPCIKFIKGKGISLLEEWSKIRSPTFTREDDVEIANPNQKVYQSKPKITTAAWTSALKVPIFIYIIITLILIISYLLFISGTQKSMI